LLLIEEFDINNIHHPRRWHGNIDGFIKAYGGEGDVPEDDDFLNVTIMTINVEGTLVEYQ
jgi:hypothetical protein